MAFSFKVLNSEQTLFDYHINSCNMVLFKISEVQKNIHHKEVGS
jgi:hypothetical protein